LFDQQRGGGRGMGVRAMLPSLLINAVAPFVAYQVLSSQGMDITQALTISAVFPLIGTIWGFVHSRRADIIGVVSLAFIVIGVATSLISGDPRFILIKESFLTAVFGLACLVSLFLARPLMFYFGRQFAGGGDPARTAAFEDLWQYESFRTVNRTMTLVWGVAYLVEAAIQVALSFVLPIPLFLVLSPMLAIGVTIALVAWTMRYARSSARRGAQRMAAMSSGKAGT
jgi:Mg/Co/Ni transporter MgtE